MRDSKILNKKTSLKCICLLKDDFLCIHPITRTRTCQFRALSCVLVRSCRYISLISEIWLHKGRNFALLFYNLPSCRKVRVWRWASHCALSLITESEEQVDGRPSCEITHPLASMSFYNGAEKTVASDKRRVLRIFWRTKMAAKPCDCIRQL